MLRSVLVIGVWMWVRLISLSRWDMGAAAAPVFTPAIATVNTRVESMCCQASRRSCVCVVCSVSITHEGLSLLRTLVVAAFSRLNPLAI